MSDEKAKQAKKVLIEGSSPLDPYVTTLLANITDGKHAMTFAKGKNVFSQGDQADAIYFVQSGRIKVSVVSAGGKEAVVAMLGPHDFFGEGCLIGQSLRKNTATTMESATIYQVGKRSMLCALRNQPELSERFMTALLTRTMHIKEVICDHLFNQSEKRLARILLNLGRPKENGVQSAFIHNMSHETLSQMVGTTRSRVTLFMNKFKTMGLIEYNRQGQLTVKTDQLTRIVA